ncbi:Protein of unknown function [Pyronema omphalodes CBS 100304]|uniref:Uncharacterized protein n=1 Tax=Pyronema omphalodes (strain CBS 100304) TaxID=1076935 RepID=U4KY12_PYROM|nr:Protein of unknown function [Pyronema omphalodes CBS 100304]
MISKRLIYRCSSTLGSIPIPLLSNNIPSHFPKASNTCACCMPISSSPQVSINHLILQRASR